MKVVSIDLGYSSVKGVNSEGLTVNFKSYAAPYVKYPMEEDLKGVVSVGNAKSESQKYFYGDRAIKEGDKCGGFTMNQEKHTHPYHDILIYTAAKKLNFKPGDFLAVGVPISYRNQKNTLKEHLQKLQGFVGVDGNEPARISFENIVVMTQGIVGFSLLESLPEGILISIDSGEKTTDISVVEYYNGDIEPVPAKCFSLETGFYTVVDTIASMFQERTGYPISFIKAREIVDKGYAIFKGEKLDFNEDVSRVKSYLTRAIVNSLYSHLGETADFAAGFYLLGGGAEVLPFNQFIDAEVMPDPQMVTAMAYLSLVEESLEEEAG
ncbi:MAG: ParM/StbA family protein [Clostridiales bacterium]|nr:ParM/StbA family protein [Clostridiales bacterium]MCF8023843.1 ParM/StbA family protein [Clostridiales bacterium]